MEFAVVSHGRTRNKTRKILTEFRGGGIISSSKATSCKSMTGTHWFDSSAAIRELSFGGGAANPFFVCAGGQKWPPEFV